MSDKRSESDIHQEDGKGRHVAKRGFKDKGEVEHLKNVELTL